MFWSGEFSIHGVVTISWTQLTVERFTAGLALSTLKVYVTAILTTFLWVECHWGKTPWYLVSSVVLWGAASLLFSSFSDCGPGNAQFALPSVGIRCLCPQSCPVALPCSYVFGPRNRGSPASKQRMSKWVVVAISPAYESVGQPRRPHSTRSMAASKALISGVAFQKVCDAAGLSSSHTFIRFYSLDLDSTPGSQVLSS